MYLTISAQKMGSTYNSSVGNYVDYLEKENEDRLPEQREEFFDHENDSVSPETVIDEIDANTAKCPLSKGDSKAQERDTESGTGRVHRQCQRTRKKNQRARKNGPAQTERATGGRRDAKRGATDPYPYHGK